MDSQYRNCLDAVRDEIVTGKVVASDVLFAVHMAIKTGILQSPRVEVGLRNQWFDVNEQLTKVIVAADIVEGSENS